MSELNQAILDHFADTPERLSAYQLGLALSDLTWLPRKPEPGTQGSAATRPSALVGLFSRAQLATTKTLLSGAGSQLPASAAAIVSQSLDNWADWLDVNAASFTEAGADAWSAKADVVLGALRVQGWVWYSVLIADPEVSAAPSMGAWVQAGSSIARATAKISGVVLRRFWPLVLIALVVLGGLLALVIVNLSGASQVWASLATVAAVVGASGVGVGSGVSSAFDGVGYEIWTAAKLDASAWNVTWLPAMTSTTAERVRLDSRGVAAPQDQEEPRQSGSRVSICLMPDTEDTNAAVWKSDIGVSFWKSTQADRERRRAGQRTLLAELLPFAADEPFTVVDLGAGTGAAARIILDHYPAAHAILADFSAQMMAQGEVELKPYEGRYTYVEFDLTKAGGWPAGIPDPVDAAISSLSVHHLNDARKQTLFAEILRHLAPGGWYLNYDPVLPPDAVVEEAWLRAGDRRDPTAADKRVHRTQEEQFRYENHVRYMIPLEPAARLPARGGLRGRGRVLEGPRLRHLRRQAAYRLTLGRHACTPAMNMSTPTS